MPGAKLFLFVLLGLFAVVFLGVWAVDLIRKREFQWPTPVQLGIGLITDFLDTLGIGSFAVTTALWRIRRTVPDHQIPGTLNVGHCLPTIAQAFIYIAIIEVDIQTLALTIAACVLGAWFGAGIVMKCSRQQVQLGMGTALLAAAGLMLARILQILPSGGDAIGLQGGPLMVALAFNFLFGALMMIGVGAYAPIMIMVSLLGMNPKAAFPIMMGSCAFLMPVAGARIIRAGAYDARAALGLTLAGIPGVLLAAFLFEGLSVDQVRWLVFIVVVYTALSMLWASRQLAQAAPDEAPVA